MSKRDRQTDRQTETVAKKMRIQRNVKDGIFFEYQNYPIHNYTHIYVHTITRLTSSSSKFSALNCSTNLATDPNKHKSLVNGPSALAMGPGSKHKSVVNTPSSLALGSATVCFFFAALRAVFPFPVEVVVALLLPALPEEWPNFFPFLPLTDDLLVFALLTKGGDERRE